MKSVFLLSPHFPEYSLEYAKSLSRRCQVTICLDADQVAREYEGRSLPSHSSLKIKLIRFKTPIDLLILFYHAFIARPAVVHIQEAVGPRRGAFCAIFVWLMCRFSLIALTVHDPVPHAGSDSLAAKKLVQARNFVRGRARIVLVHGEFCKGSYESENRHPNQKVYSIMHGSILKTTNLHRGNSSFNIKYFMFGRMEYYKGLEIVCNVFEELDRIGSTSKLMIAGSGVELDRLLHRFEILKHVTIRRGFIPPLEVIAMMQESDCILLPYLSATQSGVAAAAFANGLFAIASRTGGLPDVVHDGKNGLLAEPGDVNSLLWAIKRVEMDPGLRNTLRDGAIKFSQWELNWDRISDDVYNLLFEPNAADH